MRHVVRLIRRNSIVNPEHLDIMRPANPTAGPFALAERQNTQQGSLFISKIMSMKVRRNNFMKRHGNLYQQIISRENIEIAAQRARKRKTWQRAVKKFDEHRDERVMDIHDMLANHTFRTAQYKTKEIFEPKKRTIYILPFYPDRIVQHAIMNVLEPIWDGLLVETCYSCRKGKGQHKASARCMKYVKRYEFCYQFDIHKFYPSINHEILKKIIRKKIKDKGVLWLLDEIIDSNHSETNVPIGNYLSQWFGNIYMNELDRLIKEALKIGPYERYCDDFLIFGDNKAEMRRQGDIIEKFLNDKLRLTLSRKSLFHTYQGVDFIGYRHFHNGKLLVRKRTAKKIKRNIRALKWKLTNGRIEKDRARSTVGSVHGWLCHANTHNLSVSLQLKELREMIDNA